MSTFYVFLVNFDNISSQPENYSYDDPALWSLETTVAPVTTQGPAASTLAQRFALNRQRHLPVDIELPGGVRWTVRLRAVGAQWLSAETEGHDPRGVVISYRAIVGVRGLSPQGGPDAPVVAVPMFQAVSESIRRNPRVVLGVGNAQFVGVVCHLADDYLEILPRPGLEAFVKASARPGREPHSSRSVESIVLPLARVDYLRWLEPGDSF